MEVHTAPMVPSTSIGPSSLNSRHLVHICSQHNCRTLMWPGPSKSDICDLCLDRIRNHDDSTNPKDTTGAYAKTASCVESTFNEPNDCKEATSVAPAVPCSAVYDVASLLKSPLLPPYLLSSSESQLESTQNFEAGISSKRPGYNSASVSYQSRRSVNPPSSTISIPLYNYYGSRHKIFQSNAPSLTEEHKQSQHHLCGVCRAVVSSRYTETVCPRCRSDAALSFEKVEFDQRDCSSELKEIVSNFEDDLSNAVMSIFSNPDENLDDDDDIDMEGIELSYPEVIDSEVVKEPQLQPVQESSSWLMENSLLENVPHHSNPAVLDLVPILPKRKQNTSHSLKLCSTKECTGIISSESLSTRCLECVRRDWRFKISKAHAGHRADDGRLTSGTIKRSTPTKQKTKKAKVNKQLECDPTTQQRRNTASKDSSSKYGISTGHSADFPITIDKDPQVSLNIQVGGLPSSSTETRAPSKRSEPPTIQLNNQTTGSEDLSEDALVFTRAQEDLSISAPSTPVELASNDELCLGAQVESVMSIKSSAPLGMSLSAEVSIFGRSSDLRDLADSGDNNESEEGQEIPSPLVSTGLKFRIPPRPGLYVRKCGSIRCQQRLPAIYRWKSCVICRARSREYQRMRQNLHERHSRLDEGSQITGTPLCRDIFSDDSPPIVAGARLCSIPSCTYIIPPSSEYTWKRCALCRLRARPNQSNKIAERLPKRDKQLSGRCQSLDCGMLLSGTELTLDCDQCVARLSWLTNDGVYKRPLLKWKAKSIPAHASKSREPSPYPQYKAFPTLLADFKVRLNDFLEAQSVLFLHNAGDNLSNSSKALFVFDAEYSIVALDFDIIGHKETVDGNVLKLKGEIERMGRIRFSPKRYISILEDGGIAERFACLKQVPIHQAVSSVSDATFMKNMQGELEIAVVPDHSHPFLPGQRIIVRFRLLG
ncbi:hypothetical protein BYT27DRAFT_7335806 [Phlegmacium glaucopus]|nr:hypothetical protein BYT27DRAFT_7335806 [Phlegmacium glaucopus]